MKKFRISFNAPLVLIFLGICLLATLAGVLSGGASTSLLFMTYRSSVTNPLTYLRLFTHVFGHSGWSHFIGNATYLLLLGPMLEEKYGTPKLAAVMAVTALVTSLVNTLLFPNIALCGASGIVFAFILLVSFTNFEDGTIPLTFLLVALLFGGQQVIQGLTAQDNVSNLSHVLGGIVGAVAGYGLNKTGARRR